MAASGSGRKVSDGARPPSCEHSLIAAASDSQFSTDAVFRPILSIVDAF